MLKRCDREQKPKSVIGERKSRGAATDTWILVTDIQPQRSVRIIERNIAWTDPLEGTLAGPNLQDRTIHLRLRKPSEQVFANAIESFTQILVVIARLVVEIDT